ncbi:hypothetical protein [Gemmobacter nectariphilus]|nr:hypothetical protein [Gemmobacter nectariphilus]
MTFDQGCPEPTSFFNVEPFPSKNTEKSLALLQTAGITLLNEEIDT